MRQLSFLSSPWVSVCDQEMILGFCDAEHCPTSGSVHCPFASEMNSFFPLHYYIPEHTMPSHQ